MVPVIKKTNRINWGKKTHHFWIKILNNNNNCKKKYHHNICKENKLLIKKENQMAHLYDYWDGYLVWNWNISCAVETKTVNTMLLWGMLRCYNPEWPLSRQCKIPSRFTALLPMLSVIYSYHAGTSVIVSGGGTSATVHDPKSKWNAQVQQSQEWMQRCC